MKMSILDRGYLTGKDYGSSVAGLKFIPLTPPPKQNIKKHITKHYIFIFNNKKNKDTERLKMFEDTKGVINHTS